MKKRLVVSSLFLVLLVACGQKMSEKPKTSSIASSEVVDSSSGRKEAPIELSSQEETAEQPTPSDRITYQGQYYTVEGKYGPVIIVNKKYPLAPDYAPRENPTAVAAFWRLVGDMQVKGYDVTNQYSGFRSYETQSSLYASYVARDGQAAADRYSARPGHSEHQTGLAFDLMDSNGSLLYESQVATWLAQHAHDYGFVVRYPEGKEAITGYMAETWHIRYIGPEAVDIYQSGLTLEEYYGVEGGDYLN